MPATLETITGTFERIVWRSPDASSRFAIAVMVRPDGKETTLKGDIREDDPLHQGHRYSWQGTWEANGYRDRPPAFKFRTYVESEPLTRTEVVTYLQRKLRDVGISYGIANRLWEAFRERAVDVLRNTPEEAATHEFTQRYLSVEKAREAAVVLRKIRATSEVEMKLMGLFSGKGFPHGLPKGCIKKWGIHAYRRVSKDPFALLVAGFGGCGFARCDRLYTDLGCNPNRLKRQAICLWYAIHSDSSGHTWFPLSFAVRQLEQKVSGTRVRAKDAIRLAVHPHVGILALRQDAAGAWWIAETAKAKAEETLAARVLELSRWERPVEVDVQALGEEGIARFEVNDEDIRELLEEGGEIELAGLIREGLETGVCQFCGRELTNPESRQRGYGPICASKWGLPYGDESREIKDGNAENGQSADRGNNGGRSDRGGIEAGAGGQWLPADSGADSGGVRGDPGDLVPA